MDTYWVYLVGPFVGATLAVAFEWVLRGPATEAGRAAASGLLAPDNPTAR
jgi:hypothetical protein